MYYFKYYIEKRMPGLERERFIADTLYKKLWKHDNMPCPYRTWLFLCFYLCFIRMIGDASLEKCWETFYKEVFLFVQSHEEGLTDLTLLGNQSTQYSYFI